MSSDTPTPPSVVVLGGGYAGTAVAKSLDDVADVTLVDPTDAFVHNVAAWRALVEPEWLDRIFFPYDRLLEQGRFARDRAVAVDGRRVELASGGVLEPDYLVLATGSAYPFPAKVEEPDTDAARVHIRDAHEALAAAERVLIVGAGPSGLELAGEIKTVFPAKQVTIADVAPDILTGPYDQALRDELRRQLDGLGVNLALGSPLRALPDARPATGAAIEVRTGKREVLTADVWYRAFGVAPHTDYLRGALAEARDERGYVRVDEHLRVRGQERVFAIGDIADADRNMAAMAGGQAEVLAANLRAEITGEGEVSPYEPWPTVIAIPLGPEGGAGQFPGVEGIAGPDQISAVKGQAMLVDKVAALFTAGSAVAAR